MQPHLEVLLQERRKHFVVIEDDLWLKRRNYLRLNEGLSSLAAGGWRQKVIVLKQCIVS